MITAEHVFREHLSQKLPRYSSFLSLFAEAVRTNQIPEITQERVPKLIKEFTNYLSTVGESEDDELLLRYAIVVPGLISGASPAIREVFPERGGFYGDKLFESASQIRGIRAALKLARLALADSNANTKTMLEAAWQRLQSPVSDVDWVKLHIGLHGKGRRELEIIALDALQAQSADVQAAGWSALSAVVTIPLEGSHTIANELLKRRIFSDPHLFLHADAPVVEALVAAIEEENHALNDVLRALAWTRDREAAHVFSRWIKTPSPWFLEEVQQIQGYLHEAGWELVASGDFRDLVSPFCFRLAPAMAELDGPKVSCRIPLKDRCPACGGPLTWLFDFIPLSSNYFPGDRSNAPRRILNCVNCALNGPVFSHYHSDGQSEIHPAMPRVSSLGETHLPSSFLLAEVVWPRFAAAGLHGWKNGSSIGGCPMWIHGPEFPNCPDCNRTMPFLAQFDCSTQHGEDGIYYAFFCDECRVAAVSYQQT